MQLFAFWAALWAMLGASATRGAQIEPVRCIMYLTGQHNLVPLDGQLRSEITHVILAFMRSEVFGKDKEADVPPTDFPLFTTVDKVRSQFDPGTKVMVAIGGWGDVSGFQDASRHQETRQRWAARVRDMVDVTGADGVDIDWEYPGGNRDDYKTIPNSQREWEVEAFVELLVELRRALGRDKLLSVAVPGMERDLMAFTKDTVPRLIEQLDFINVMTYDLMNRRDTVVRHHSGVEGSEASIQRYIDRGAPSRMLNLGLGYYAKWFMTQSDCDPEQPVGCSTQLLEDPVTGADLGGTAAFSWHDEVPEDLAASFSRAVENGKYHEDGEDGGFGYWDALERRWWSWDTPEVIRERKLPLLASLDLGGVFAWGLGEDAPEFAHLKATVDGVKDLGRKYGSLAKDEL